MIHEYTSGHVCEICARQFKTKQTLQTHFENEHSETPRPKLQCNICGAWLKHKRDLIKHLQRHQDINDANVETFKCTICDKVAPNKHALSGHMRSVHIEERHVCTLCSKSFKRAKNLKVRQLQSMSCRLCRCLIFFFQEHMAWHTGEDLYDCAYCEKKFKSNANMYSHRKKAHLAEWTRDFPQRTPFQRTSTNEEIEAQLNTLNAKFKWQNWANSVILFLGVNFDCQLVEPTSHTIALAHLEEGIFSNQKEISTPTRFIRSLFLWRSYDWHPLLTMFPATQLRLTENFTISMDWSCAHTHGIYSQKSTTISVFRFLVEIKSETLFWMKFK